MRGEVISVDGISGDGLISGDDGARYAFTSAASRSALRVGDKVDFVGAEGIATNIMNLSGAPTGGHAYQGDRAAPGPSGSSFNFATAMFSFQGRLRRSHFWIGWAIVFFGYYVWTLIPFLNLLLLLVSPVLIWCNLALGTKRLHDMGKSGWLIAIPWVAMTIGFIYAVVVIVMAALSDPVAFENSSDPMRVMGLMAPALGAWGVTALIGIAFWLWLGIADSQPRANQYGPSPKQSSGGGADTFS